MRFLIINILFVLYLGTLINGQVRNTTVYTIKDGLNTSETTALTISNSGLLIIGTYGGGINIFDGSEFEAFGTLNGMSNNNIRDLLLDSQQNLWIATEHGLTKFDGENFSVVADSGNILQESISAISLSSDNELWAATENGICRIKNSTVKDFSHLFKNESNSIGSIYSGDPGLLVIGYRSQIIFYDITDLNNPVIKNTINCPNAAIYKIFKDHQGTYYFGTSKGLYIFKNNELKLYTTKDGLSSNLVTNIYEDNRRRIWLSTSNGITVFDRKNFTILGKEQGLTNSHVWSITQDTEGNIWLAGRDGLFKYNRNQVELFAKYKKNILDAWYMHNDSNNNFWIGTDVDGLLLYSDSKFIDFWGNSKLKSKTVRFITEDSNNRLWLATDQGVYAIHDNSIASYDKSSGFINESTMSIYEDENGNLIFGTYGYGIYIFDGTSFFNYSVQHGLKNPIVYNILRYNNLLLLGTEQGLYQFEEGKFKIPDLLQWTQNLSIMSLLVDEFNNLWIATYEKGIFLIRNGNFANTQNIDESQGLNDNAVLAMVFDKDKNLWVGTNSGINKIDLSDFKSTGNIKVYPFFSDDGLLGLECVQSAAALDDKGYIWFGTVAGILRFNPSLVKENLSTPKILIKSVKGISSNYEITTYNKNLFQEDNNQQVIRFSSTTNVVEIHFTGISLTATEKVSYRYFLSSEDQKSITNEKFVRFTNLDPGDYTFSVSSINSHGVENLKPAKIHMYIDSPFYRTIPFYILTGIFALSILYAVNSYSTRRIKRKNRELEERIDERLRYEAQLEKSEKELILAKETAERSDKLKSEILAHMSHEIRTPVNSILNFTSLIRSEAYDKVSEDIKEGFRIIENSGIRLIRTIDLIINMSQLQTGNFEIKKTELNVVQIISSLFTEFAMRIKEKGLQFQIHNELKDPTIFADEYSVTQIFANLIDNSYKYTSTGVITISMFGDDKFQIVEIADSGIGMSEEYQKKLFTPFLQEEMGYTRRFEGTGLGLALVKNYCELNGADIEVDSMKFKGTTFRIKFPK